MKDHLLHARRDSQGEAVGPGAERDVAWWSVTKTAIAALALRLATAGRIDLDASPRALSLPGTANPTLRALLGHRAGLPDYGALPAYHAAVARGESAWPFEDLLARAADLPRPGGWHYSNIGYALARHAIEAATNQPLDTLLRDWVLAPLGIVRARIARERAEMAELALPAPDYDPAWVYHGCLIGPPAEAARLIEGIVAGRLLRPRDHAMLMAAQPLGGPLAGRPWRETGYGLGLMIGTMARGGARPIRAIGHSAGGPGSSGAVYHFPDLPGAPTVAIFAEDSEGRTEAAALGYAHGDYGGGEAKRRAEAALRGGGRSG